VIGENQNCTIEGDPAYQFSSLAVNTGSEDSPSSMTTTFMEPRNIAAIVFNPQII